MGPLSLPNDFAFQDTSNEGDPNTSALHSFSETSQGSIFSSLNESEFNRSASSFDLFPSSQVSNESDVTQNTKMYCEPTELDVLLGRGGLTNNHAGNIRYREEVEKVKPMYFSCKTKPEKKEVSELLVAYVQDYGGRFLVKDPETNRWMLAPMKAARKKASQALRETKWKQSKEKKEESPG